VSYDGRSALLARHLNAAVHFVSFGQRGKVIQAPFRYLIQAIRTWSVLYREKPNIIFVQAPPIFSVMIVFLYARLFGSKYVIDTHSSSFLSRIWGMFLGVHRFLSRRALTTIVPNEELGKIVRSWGCHTSVLGFTPGIYPPGEPFQRGEEFCIAVISSFDPDEPIEVVLEAAHHFPDITFYVTGNFSHIDPQLEASRSDNCKLTGYLPFDCYIGLLRGVDAVMDLTNWDHTLLLGAYEAVELEKPLITSDWPILRQYFSSGTVHVPNTVEGICSGVQRVQDEHQKLSSGIVQLREELHAEWNRKFVELERLLSTT
jgi:hypothetical protein